MSLRWRCSSFLSGRCRSNYVYFAMCGCKSKLYKTYF